MLAVQNFIKWILLVEGVIVKHHYQSQYDQGKNLVGPLVYLIENIK